MSASSLDSTSVFNPQLRHILTALLGLTLTGPDNLHVEMFRYHGISCFSHFKVLHPSDFTKWSFLTPGNSITDQGPVPASISEGLADVLYYHQNLTTIDHADKDTTLGWTHADFNLFCGVLFIDNDDDAPSNLSVAMTNAAILDQELDHILTLLLALMLSDDHDALVGDDDFGDVPLATSAATKPAAATWRAA